MPIKISYGQQHKYINFKINVAQQYCALVKQQYCHSIKSKFYQTISVSNFKIYIFICTIYFYKNNHKYPVQSTHALNKIVEYHSHFCRSKTEHLILVKCKL